MRKIAKNNATKQPLSDAWLAWCGRAIGDMDFDVTLHLPHHLAHHPNSDILSQHLNHLFNRLDRYFLGTAHRRHHLRIPRFVTLERTDGVGWHAHVSLKIWRDAQGYVIEPDALSAQLKSCWHEITRQPMTGKFSGLVVCFKPTHERFLSYSLKQIDVREGHRGEVDVLNCAPDRLLAA